jgi:RNA polymerase sigma factor (sigma-70 family)
LEDKGLKSEFAAIIAGNQGILHKITSLYVSDPELKKDLFQEILYQLWRSYPGFRHESKVSTWIYRVALNTAISHLRKKKNDREINSLPEKLPELPEDNEYEIKSRQFQMMYRSIEKLDKVDKAIIMLYLEGSSYEEISEVMGITSNHVGVKLNRIKTKLKQMINQLENE